MATAKKNVRAARLKLRTRKGPKRQIGAKKKK